MNIKDLPSIITPRYVCILVSYWVIGLTGAYFSQYFFLDEVAKRAFASLAAPFVAEWLYSGISRNAFGDVTAKPQLHGLQPEGTPRAAITVALVTDDDLKAYGATYPLPYGFHAERLDSIASHGPKAIFIDIAFLDAREDNSLDELIATVCQIRKEQGIPVFLASLDYINQPLRSELEKAHAEQACFEKVAVPRQLDRYDRNNWEYPLQLGEHESTAASPALALFKSMHPSGTTLANDKHPASLGLLWGMEPHPYNVEWLKRQDRTKLCRSEWDWYRELPLISLINNIGERDEYAKLREKNFCPYHASFPLHFLSSKPEVVQQLVRDRVVMYGVDLQSVGDYSFSPLHGSIPGIFVHAMALDNLLAFKGDYPRAMEFQPLEPWTAGTIFPVAMVTIAALLAAIFYYIYEHPPEIISKHFDDTSNDPKPHEQIANSPSTLTKKVIDSPQHADQSCWRRITRVAMLFAQDAWAQKSFVLRAIMTIPLYALVLVIVGAIGIKWFHLGMLSWIEYALLPMLLETFHAGNGFSRYLQGLYRAGFDPSWATESELGDTGNS